jgi:hypothetical protein
MGIGSGRIAGLAPIPSATWGHPPTDRTRTVADTQVVAALTEVVPATGEAVIDADAI